MAHNSSTFAQKIPWTEEPGRLQSMGSLESDTTERFHFHFSLFTFMHWRRKWQPTPVFLPGESQGREAWWAVIYGVAQSRTRLKRCSSSILTQTEQTDNCHREKNAQLGKISEQYSERQTSTYNSNHKCIIHSKWNVDNNTIIIGGFPVNSK